MSDYGPEASTATPAQETNHLIAAGHSDLVPGTPRVARQSLRLLCDPAVDKLTSSLSSAATRRLIIDQSMRAGVGHIGPALSITDILVALFSAVIDADNDVFILSKGHAALAYYCVLYQLGKLTAEILDTYCADDTYLGVHPEHALDEVTFSTGSLGTGPALGIGVALAKTIRRQSGRVFVLMSDAELNEGSVWEALMFAGHHKLANVCFVIDSNGQQALAPTRDVLDLSGFPTAAESLGWECHRVDGHDVKKLQEALGTDSSGRPRMVIADTICGKGVSFMERQVAWHYMPLDADQYVQAMDELQ